MENVTVTITATSSKVAHILFPNGDERRLEPGETATVDLPTWGRLKIWEIDLDGHDPTMPFEE